jgi:hypothetical protein
MEQDFLQGIKSLKTKEIRRQTGGIAPFSREIAEKGQTSPLLCGI